MVEETVKIQLLDWGEPCRMSTETFGGFFTGRIIGRFKTLNGSPGYVGQSDDGFIFVGTADKFSRIDAPPRPTRTIPPLQTSKY